MEWDESPLIGSLLLLYKTVLHDFHKREFGFTKTQLLVFYVLRFRGSVTMTELAEFLSAAKEQTTRAVAPLVDAGYVERFEDRDNRTKVHIRLTESGSGFFARYMQKRSAELDEMTRQQLSGDEQRELMQALHTANRLLQKLL